MDQPNDQLDQHDNWDDFSEISKAEQKILGQLKQQLSYQ